MDRDYWDARAADYRASILNVWSQDRQRVLPRFLDEFIAADAAVGDFGCGIGNGLGLLARRARRVLAVDHSAQLLAQAQRRWRRHKNVEYHQCDLTKRIPDAEPLACIGSVNVLIAAQPRIRQAILANIRRALARRGVALLVVPSLESQLWVYNQLFEQALASSGSRSRAQRKAQAATDRELVRPAQGIVRLEGTDTKFFLGPELDAWLSGSGFALLAREAVPYSWGEELDSSPGARAAKPWHWLAAVRKRG